MKSPPYSLKTKRKLTPNPAFVAIVMLVCQCASAARPQPISPEAREVVLAMHWLTHVVPLPPPPASPPSAPMPFPSPTPAAPSSGVPVCPPGDMSCDKPALPLTIDQNYRGAYVPDDVVKALVSELPRLIKLLPPDAAAKLTGWSISISNCSTAPPFILVCRNSAARVIRIAPILVKAIFGNESYALVDVQQKLQSMGADPASFDGSYQPEYSTHGKTEADWKAVLRAYAQFVWTPFVSSVDFVIAQEVASIYLQPDNPLPATDSRVIQAAKRLSTPLHGVYDPSGLLGALGSATGKYDHSTWAYERAGDVDAVINAIPANSP